MRYAHISCGWSKRLKPNESRRAFIRSAWLRFAAMLTSASVKSVVLTVGRPFPVFPISRPFQGPSACLEGATSRHNPLADHLVGAGDQRERLATSTADDEPLRETRLAVSGLGSYS
jgi:hypothetical protein